MAPGPHRKMHKHVALANGHRWTDPTERTAYIGNVPEADRILSKAFGSRRFEISRLDWTDAEIDRAVSMPS